MSRNCDNPVVLSFYESLLRVSDVELLHGTRWLNDTVISFYFEYLEKMVFINSPFLLFVPPQVTQCIKIAPKDEISLFLRPLTEQPRKFIFFALNDNQTEFPGGTHWTLLVFSYPEKMIYHYDSSRGSNRHQAIELGEKILEYFRLPTYGCFSEVNCLQQTNGYDCGIHVICNAENIAQHVTKYHTVEGCPIISPLIVDTKRNVILKLISDLRQSF